MTDEDRKSIVERLISKEGACSGISCRECKEAIGEGSCGSEEVLRRAERVKSQGCLKLNPKHYLKGSLSIQDRISLLETLIEQGGGCTGVNCQKCKASRGYDPKKHTDCSNSTVLSEAKEALVILKRDEISEEDDEEEEERIQGLQTNHYYKWTGPKVRQSNWNHEGEMDFMLDGLPHLCTYGSGHSGKFKDSPDPTYLWTWSVGIQYIKDCTKEISTDTDTGKCIATEYPMSQPSGIIYYINPIYSKSRVAQLDEFYIHDGYADSRRSVTKKLLDNL